MSETTVRRKLKEMGLHLVVSTEMYAGAKRYAIYDNDVFVIAYQSVEDLAGHFLDSVSE